MCSVIERVWATTKHVKRKDTIAHLNKLVVTESLEQWPSYGRQRDPNEAAEDATMEEAEVKPDKR